MFAKKEPSPDAKCPHCRGRMEAGAVSERPADAKSEQVWVSTSGLKGVHVSRPFPVTAMRCSRCGYLAFYAF